MRKTLLIINLLALAALAACGRQPADAPATAETPRNVTASVAVGSADGGLVLLWTLQPADGWHLYWDGLNDSGYPPTVAMDLPEGWSAGPLEGPAPERYVQAGGLLDHVYHRETMLVQRLSRPAGAAAEFTVKVSWLACRASCVPGDTALTVRVPAGDPPPVALPDLPGPLPAGVANAVWADDVLRLEVPGATGLRFFPFADCGRLVDILADGEVRGDRLALRFRPAEGKPGPAHGLLQIQRDGALLTGSVLIPSP